MEKKYVYLVEQYYSGENDWGFYEYEKIDSIIIFSNLEKAKEFLKGELKWEYLNEFISDDGTELLLNDSDYGRKLKNYQELQEVINVDFENGNSPSYWKIVITKKVVN